MAIRMDEFYGWRSSLFRTPFAERSRRRDATSQNETSATRYFANMSLAVYRVYAPGTPGGDEVHEALAY